MRISEEDPSFFDVIGIGLPPPPPPIPRHLIFTLLHREKTKGEGREDAR
jgi:hypothetical protein